MRGLQALSVVVGLLGVWIGQGAHAALQVLCTTPPAMYDIAPCSHVSMRTL